MLTNESKKLLKLLSKMPVDKDGIIMKRDVESEFNASKGDSTNCTNKHTEFCATLQKEYNYILFLKKVLTSI